jgi:hypothetical protein
LTNPEQEKILVRVTTLCKRTASSLAHAETDTIAGSGCISDFYTTKARCLLTAIMLYSGNFEKVHFLKPKNITPLYVSEKMFAEHKMSGTLTLLLSLDVKLVNNFQKNKEYFNTHYKIYPQLRKRFLINYHQDIVSRDIYNQYKLNADT